uniref:Uncharacterized protein n=1 Tax=Rhizophora mucronata TaxID=61149 RepID=A0A2P2IZQ6_RHIMU
MLSLYCLSLYNKQPLTSPPKLSFITNKKKSTCLEHGDCPIPKKTITNQYYSESSTFIVRAVEKDSQQDEINPDKAKEALKELDQQLQTLSKKQVSPPKIKGSLPWFNLLVLG